MFQTDLQEAHQVEIAAIPRLERFIPGSEAWINRLSPFICDVWWRWPEEKPLKVEVKYDRLSSRTGNVAIEHKAILNSTSDLVVYHLPPYWYLFYMLDIKNFIGQYPEKRGGDQPDNLLTLVPNERFIRRGTFI